MRRQLDGGRNSLSSQIVKGERHDGRNIPSKLYWYTIEGKPLKPASLDRARRGTIQVERHLEAAGSRLDERTYKPMTPFRLGIAQNDTAIHTKNGLVYHVLRQTNGEVYSSLLYTFYVPLDFLEYPLSQSVST
jgi:hypothetical protein